MSRIKKILIWAILPVAVTVCADTVLLTDNFGDSSIDLSKWTLITGTGHTSFDESYSGGTVTEQSGYLFIQNAAGAYKSKLLPVDGLGEIVVTRRIYVSSGSGTLISRPDEIVAEDGTVLMRWGYHNYNDGVTARYGFGGFDDTLTTGFWNNWYNETITYDPLTGAGTYSVNGSVPVAVTGSSLPDGTTNLYLRGSAYAVGSSTDYKAFEDFTVTQTDRSLLTVSSPYGSPVPGIGTNAYDTGSTVTCSVANVTIDGIDYECTGWIGTGSVPASGTTNEVIFTLSENSSITWKWRAMLLEDDFEDSVLDPAKWSAISATGASTFNASSVGSSLSETNGVMNISHSAQSSGGAYETALLPVDDQGRVVIERRTKVHSASPDASMTESLLSESGNVLLSWGYYNYNFWGTVRYGFGGINDARASGIWDEWFDEVITYDPVSGRGTYAINGSTPILISGTAMPDGTTNVVLRGGAYGAYTGHTKQFETFTVSQGEPVSLVVLTVNSAQGSPSPAVGKAVYDAGSTVTCSVENVVSGSTLYACTGWSGTGAAPVSGSTNEVVVTLTEDSSISWNWETTGQWLAINVVGNGSVSHTNGYYEPGSVQTLAATPDDGSWFAGWGGHASGTTDVDITMDAPKTITATFRDVVLLEDDFNDGVLNTSKWTVIKAGSYGFDPSVAGSSLVESNGSMNISHDVDGAGGAYQSSLLPVTRRGLITIERRVKLHSAGTPRMLERLMTADGTTLVYWFYAPEGFGLGTSLPAAVWDEWFDEVIIYDPITGQSTYSINGSAPVRIISGTAMPYGTTQVYLQGGAAGDGTGYTKQLDSFTVSQGEDSSRAILTVSSSRGTPVPAAGVTTYNSGTTVTCSVESVIISGGTRYECTGWTGTGSVPASGTANSVEVLMNADSTLVWNWQAADHWMEISTEGNGSVNLSSGYYPAGSQQTLVALPDPGWVLYRWNGIMAGAGDATVTMSGPKDITAVFACPPPEVTATVSQVEGTRDIAISCAVPEGGNLVIGIEVYQNGTNLNASSFSGAGMLRAGTNQVITWHAGTDWNRNVDELTFNLLLDNGCPQFIPYEGGTVNLPRTGQNNDYGLAGTDGDIQPGLSWPSPRFTDNGDNTITDNMTGLIWWKNVGSPTTWFGALNNCDNSTLAGRSDWRLPNVRELRSLFADYSTSLENTPGNYPPNSWLWSSTTDKGIGSQYNYNYKYLVQSGGGVSQSQPAYYATGGYWNSYNQYVYTYSYYNQYYLAVCGSSTGVVNLAKTGQVGGFDYRYDEDGDLQMGTAWPEPRFTDHGDGTATDHLTGLMWTTASRGPAAWSTALDACNNLTTGGYADWRLPSVNELESLINYNRSRSAPTLPVDHPFTGILSADGVQYGYWSGTVHPGSPSQAYVLTFYDGYIRPLTVASSTGRYLACRGGIEIRDAFPPEPSAQLPLPATGQTNSYAANDDGAVQAGEASPSPRFTLLGDGIIHDDLTGLYWSTVNGQSTWQGAVAMANQSSWRLPNIRELLSLMDFSQAAPALPEGHLFPAIQSNAKYWTSSSMYDLGGNSTAWQVDLRNGSTVTAAKTNIAYYAIVSTTRDQGAPAPVPITGQTNSYYAADDGAEQRGVQETGDRFIDNGNYTVSDNRTGLMWLKAANACGVMNWNEAVQYCADLNYGGYSDWRLPNLRELESLVDYSQGGSQTVLPSGHPFTDINISGSHFFWTSTTSALDSGKAFGLTLYNGSFLDGSKASSLKVWPVRGGN